MNFFFKSSSSPEDTFLPNKVQIGREKWSDEIALIGKRRKIAMKQTPNYRYQDLLCGVCDVCQNVQTANCGVGKAKISLRKLCYTVFVVNSCHMRQKCMCQVSLGLLLSQFRS